MNRNKPFNKQIKPFNFFIIGSEVDGIIPTAPFTNDLKGKRFDEFIDYRTGKSSKELPLPSNHYWKSLDDVLTQYVRHNDNKFNYIEGIAHRKHIVVDKIRFIGKESNNLDEINVLGVKDDSVMEYSNVNKFYNWILELKPSIVKEWNISEIGLKKVKQKIRSGRGLKNRSKIIRILYEKFKSKEGTI